MRPIDYFQKLNEEQKLSYARRAGCSIHHMRMNLFVRAGAKKLPRPELLVGLVLASEGQVSLDEAIDYFLVAPVRKLAAELAAPALPTTVAVEMPVRAVGNQGQMEWAVLPMDGGVGL